MKVKCPNCLPKDGVEIENISEENKQEVVDIVSSKRKIFAVNHLKTRGICTLGEAKYLITHYNDFGKCQKCDHNISEAEFVNCLKCGALNLNWRKKDI